MIEKTSPLIIAHRGSSEEAYENSMEAFNLAVSQKADMIELDSHLTSDGIFIIHHDKNIVFENKKYLIKETPFKVIEKIQLPNGESIPILEDVLNDLLPNIQFNIEIKCKINKQELDILLKRVGQDNTRIVVSSFRRDVMHELKSSNMEYRLAFLYMIPSTVSRRMSDKSYIHSLNAYHKFLSSRIIELYHKKNKEVNAWTVNREDDIKKFVRLGVNGIITDHPPRAMKIIKSINQV
ncbi:MAG: glycerophosphodiester phosphodiesterase [Asgard group archaeon]|nr:glycerophosphodiester phosphodiesterase [Asgard group archaeon]